MSEFIQKCEVCQALLDEEDLFCANCGTAAPQPNEGLPGPDQGPRPANGGPVTVDFECDGCGASMSFDPQAGALRCPFCGNKRLRQQHEPNRLRPRRVVPFAVDRKGAVKTLRQWLGKGFWRPGDLARLASIAKLSPVYVPYWVFSARTLTYWTADSSHTPAGARGDWYPLTGEYRGEYAGLLVGASGALTPHETLSICPFDLSDAVAPDTVRMQDEVVEQFRVKRKYARPLARQGLEAMEAQACQRFVPGRCRNMKVNVRIEGLSSEPVLLPVWIAAYRYKNRLYRFLVNGQTAAASGEAPVSWAKISIATLVVAAMIVLVLLLALMAN
jgi:DNA-directed RNA polymerase subunit RPC12/RpoP